MTMRDEQIQKYLDAALARAEIARPVAAADMFDFSLVRNLK